MHSDAIRPWEELAELIAKKDAAGLESFWRELPPEEAPRILDRLSGEDRARLLELMDAEQSAILVEYIPEHSAGEIIEKLPASNAAAILHELPSDEQADLINELHAPEARAILAEMEPEEARQVLQLSVYPGDVAGGLMITEYVAYRAAVTVDAVIQDLRKNRARYEDYNVLYMYVIDDVGGLAGVLRLRDALLSPARAALADLAHKSVSVGSRDSLEELEAYFERYPFLALPVVEDDKLVGVVERDAVQAALAARSEQAYRASQGIVLGEEVRSMPVLVRTGRRLSWLSVNIVLNVAAASVIAFFEDTLSAVIALAVFLPIVSDMSGCSGNQAVAVSVRELALGIARPGDVFRVWRQEVVVGLLNGVVLGLLIAAVAWGWRGSPYLGLVVGVALALNTVVAVSIGGMLPLVLKKAGRDPALASGPILTTVTDMCGFFLVLGLATLMLGKLVGA